MARGQTLANVLLRLKGEIQASLTTGVNTSIDENLYTMIDMKQRWLADLFDWSFLETRAEVTVAAAGRYSTFPTSIRQERLKRVAVLQSSRWRDVTNGIGEEEYNIHSSGAGSVVTSPVDPIQRWRVHGALQFETWPITVAAQIVQFTGQAPLTTLLSGTTYDSTATLDLDDTLVILFAASEILSNAKKPSASLKLAMAEQHLATLRSNAPTEDKTVVFGGNREQPEIKRVAVST